MHSMPTMHPVVVYGSYRWDQDVLPLDEFEERLRTVRAIMKREGYHGLVVHGDPHDSALLTWLTNAYPRLRFQLALIGLEGEPELLAAGATRDLPGAAALTWCRSFQSINEAPRLLADWRSRIAARLREACTEPTIAVHGLQRMRGAARDALHDALGTRLAETTQTLDPLLATKRWRELRVLREAHAILAGAVQTLRQQWAAGQPVKAAVLDAERVARRAQALDVRILFSLDGGATLQPFETMSQERPSQLVCYVAVRYLGYWASAFVTEGMADSAALRAANARLDALRASARPGADGAALAAAVPPVPAGCQPHPMVGDLLAHGTGLNLVEAPFLNAQSTDTLCEGGVYTLQAGFTGPAGEGALLSRTVCIVDGEAQDLFTAAA